MASTQESVGPVFKAFFRVLVLAGVLSMAMWGGFFLRGNISGTLLILLVAMLVIGILIYGYNFALWNLPRVFCPAELVVVLVIIVDVAKVARKNLLAIEDSLPSIENEYLRNSLRLVVDRVDRELITEIINADKTAANNREGQWLNQWKTLSHLVLMLGFLLSAYQIVRSQNFEFGTYQFYPLLLGGMAWMILFYVSYRIKDLLENRILQREMIAAAILAIEKNERAEFIEQMLFCQLPQHLAQVYEELKYGLMESVEPAGIEADDQDPEESSPIQDAEETLPPLVIKELEPVLAKINSAESLTPSFIEELEVVLGKDGEDPGVGGVKEMAEMLNTKSKTAVNQVLELIYENNPDLAEQIRELMFTFDDLILIHPNGIQTILKETRQHDLVLALKGSSAAVQEHIFSCMSERAADMVRDDLDALGPVLLSDIEAAQRIIVQTARRMEEEDKIIIADGKTVQ